MSPLDIAFLAVLGAVLGLDVVSFPQAMLSRPIVAATITGALLGAPERGVLLGITLECFALETLPVGASRYPEWGSSSVVGGALFAFAPMNSGGALVLAVLATLTWAWVGGWSMVHLRRLNAFWAHRRHEAVARGSRRTVVGLQLYGLSADMIRGGLMTAIGLAIFEPLVSVALPRWNTESAISRDFVIALAAIVALGAGYKTFHSIPGARWLFGAGFSLGLLLIWLAR